MVLISVLSEILTGMIIFVRVSILIVHLHRFIVIKYKVGSKYPYSCSITGNVNFSGKHCTARNEAHNSYEDVQISQE